jgi:hypothetical protein
MHIDNCLAPLKFLEDRLQDWVSEVHAVGIGEENNAVETENVEGVGEFFQGGIDIR